VGVKRVKAFVAGALFGLTAAVVTWAILTTLSVFGLLCDDTYDEMCRPLVEDALTDNRAATLWVLVGIAVVSGLLLACRGRKGER